MTHLDYWEECLSDAFAENGVTVTSEQLSSIARNVENAHEGYGMAFYQLENPIIGELADVKRALRAEQEKVICRVCNGHGRITSQGPYHSSNSQCYKCNGEGKHKP